jgi:radical SAM superfamily enzyme YgiQ (UPF0313 family)
MNLLFVNPCLRYDAPHRYLPMGLGYIVTAAKEAGYAFDLLDIDLHHFDDDYVESYIRNNSYDVIALGSIVTHYKWIKWFVHTVKKYHPHCKVIVGNSVGSSIPDLLLNNAPADIVVLGEGDITTVETLDALNQGKTLEDVEGIVYRNAQNEIVHNGTRKAVRKVDDLPYPDWDIFEVEKYLELCKLTAHDNTTLFPKEEAIVMPVNTARGCVHKCTFCHYVFWNDPYRHRSVESILGEIRRNQAKYGANYINFWDELSFAKLNQAEKFADALLEANLGIHWTAAIRSDLFGKDNATYEKRREVAEKFVKSGALVVGYSLESANDEILASMNKRVESEHFSEQIRLLNEVGLRSITSLVLGYPEETLETIGETMQFCIDHGIYPSSGFLMPMPATGMWDYAIEHGYITDEDKYLTEMTERQDLVVNMTQIPDDVLVAEVKGWLERINHELNVELDPDRLLKTGGYHKHTKKTMKKVINKSRNTNDSLSYAKVSGSL